MTIFKLYGGAIVCSLFVGGAYGQFGQIDPLVPDDPHFHLSGLSPYGQHWLHSTNVTFAWSLAGYDQPWSIDESDANRTIAFIDTGIDTSHPEFIGDMVLPSKIHSDSRSFVDGGANWGGICECVPAHYDVEDIEDTMSAYNLNPHGTLLSGIAGAYGDNGEGIAGVCWDCTLLVLRVSVLIPDQTECGVSIEGCTYSEQTVADSIKYAAGWNPNGSWGAVRARVICTAIEGTTFYGDVCDTGNLVSQAIDEAHSRGCIIVAIAGNAADAYIGPCWSNTGPNEPNCDPSPSWDPDPITSALAWNPKTITVGGACRSGAAWHCQSQVNPPIEDLGSCGPSLYPVRPLDNTAPVLSVVAPSEDIISTYPESDYEFLGEFNTGTSFAAPQVAGVVALMLKTNPALTPDQVKYILEVTATDLETTGYDRYTGHGLLNARAALEYVQKQYLPADWNGDGSVGPIDPILYTADYVAGDPMTDLNLDTAQTTDDMTIFLDSYNGQ